MTSIAERVFRCIAIVFICQLHWILGDQLYVLNEQYIVKPGVFSSSERNNAKKEDQDQDDSGLRSRKRQKRTAKPIVSTAFKWHRDADYLRLVGCTPEPSISVWCCLDDVSVVNGTLTFAPLDEPNERIVITEKERSISNGGKVESLHPFLLHRCQ